MNHLKGTRYIADKTQEILRKKSLTCIKLDDGVYIVPLKKFNTISGTHEKYIKEYQKILNIEPFKAQRQLLSQSQPKPKAIHHKVAAPSKELKDIARKNIKTKDHKVEDHRVESHETKDHKVEEYKAESPKVEEYKAESPETKESKVESPEVESHKVETPEAKDHKVETPEAKDHKVESPETKDHKVESPETKESKVESPEVESHDVDTPETKESKAETPETKESKVETPETKDSKVDIHKVEGPKVESSETEDHKVETPETKESKVEISRIGSLPLYVMDESKLQDFDNKLKQYVDDKSDIPAFISSEFIKKQIGNTTTDEDLKNKTFNANASILLQHTFTKLKKLHKDEYWEYLPKAYKSILSKK